jgi:putative transposase
MAGHAFHQLYYHYVWTTKNRVERLAGDTLVWLLRELDVEAHKRGGILLAHNAMPGHLHLLVTLPPTLCVATYIGQVKGAIAHTHNKVHPTASPIEWQEGYGVISLLKAQSDRAVNYVLNQQAIHAARKTRRILEQTEPTD